MKHNRTRFLIGCFAILLSFHAGLVLGKTKEKPNPDAAIIAASEKLMANTLKDPDSVKFDGVVYSKETHAVCGKFNAKNSYGAYVGYALFAVGEDKVPHTYSGSACQGPATPEKADCLKKAIAEIHDIKAECSAIWPDGPK